MKSLRWLALAFLLLSIACQPQTLESITILDNGQTQTIQTNERVPLLVLTQAGYTLSPNDRVLLNGIQIPLDQSALITGPATLQIRRAVSLTLIMPDGQQTIASSATTVGETLSETGIQQHVKDFLDPPANTLITNALTINYTPSREVSIYSGGQFTQTRSSAGTVGEILAEAGIPLIGLDYSSPSENEPPPVDGEIRVVRVNEIVTLVSKPIPYETEIVESPEVELGTQEVLQPGQEGLSIARTRIRYEDGQEVSRITESESVVSAPQNRVVKTGVNAVVNTIAVDGVSLDYWRAYEMYATIYSPCNSGTGGCSYGTASGLRAGKGVVAVDPSMYSYLQGQRVYIPGYGFAVIGDIGGGYIIEDLLGVSRYRWIDLGFDDNNIVDLSGWLTVYFLAPVPAAIPPAMQ
jgi:uncharacterized protein YabE (DUF348 family)